MTNFIYSGICMNAGRPPENLTAELWQEIFEKFKKLPRRFGRGDFMPGSCPNQDNNCSNYALYVRFINDILRNIRQGNEDYCYFLYQIRDLTEYEPHLESSYDEEGRYFKVWIKSENLKPYGRSSGRKRSNKKKTKIKKPFKNNKQQRNIKIKEG